MLATLGSLFDSSNFAPHGLCLLWQPERLHKAKRARQRGPIR